MVHLARTPSEPLSEHVASLWLQRDPRLPGPGGWPPTVLLPDGSLDLVLGFGDPFEVLSDDPPHRLKSSHVAGLRSRPLTLRATGRTGLLIVRFHPWAVPSWVRGFASARELADRVVDLEDLGLFVGELEERLALAASDFERFELVEAWLLSRMPAERPNRSLQATLRVLAEEVTRRASGSVTEAARVLGIGRREVHRRVSAGLGLGPKVLERVLRFQRAMALARNGSSLAVSALASGYHDQPHFTREVRNLTARSPRQLLGEVERQPLVRAFGRGTTTYA